MTSKAFDNATDANRQQGGRRNLIINGGFNVWQRGTSSTGALSNAYATADRWNFNTRSCATRNISQENFTVGQTDVPGNPEYYLRGEFSNDSGGNGPFIMQRIESVQTGAAQTLTFSFWAKADASQTITPALSQQFGSGGSSAVDVNSTPSTITVGTSWERHTVTFDVPSISGKTIGSSSYLRVDFRLPANTAITFDVAQVQLEVGSVATPFEHRSYGEELALCQRYYYRETYESNTYQFVSLARVNGASGTTNRDEVVAHFKFPVTQRAAPTLYYSSAGSFRLNDNTNDEQCDSIQGGSSSAYGQQVTFSKPTGNFYGNHSVYINRQVTASPCWLAWDAEL